MTIALTGFMGCGKSSVGHELSRLISCPCVDLDTLVERREGLSIPEIFRTLGEPAFRAMELSALRFLLPSADTDTNITDTNTDTNTNITANTATNNTDTDNKTTATTEDTENADITDTENTDITDTENTDITANTADNKAPTLIISLGGGTLTTPACAGLIRRQTVCVYLRATLDTLEANLLWPDTPADPAASRPMLQSPLPLRDRIAELMAEREPAYLAASRLTVDTDGLSPAAVARSLASRLFPAASGKKDSF